VNGAGDCSVLVTKVTRNGLRVSNTKWRYSEISLEWLSQLLEGIGSTLRETYKIGRQIVGMEIESDEKIGEELDAYEEIRGDVELGI